MRTFLSWSGRPNQAGPAPGAIVGNNNSLLESRTDKLTLLKVTQTIGLIEI